MVSEEYPGSTPELPRHVDREVLGADPLEVVVATSLLGDATLVKEGGNLPWALEPVGAASRAWAVQHCLGLGFSPTVQYESYDLDLLLLLVHQGAAASILPRLVLRRNGRPRRSTRLDTAWSRTLVSLARQARAE